MKTFLFSLAAAIIFYSVPLSAQSRKKVSKKILDSTLKAVADDTSVPILSTDPALKIGLGLGYRFNVTPLKEAFISPIDSTLQFQKLPGSAFVISATLIFQLGKREQRKVVAVNNGVAHIYSERKYNLVNKNDRAFQNRFGDPGTDKLKNFSILASLNLVDIDNDGASFNKSIDGGLGIGYKFAEQIHGGLFVEYTNARQLRSYLADKLNGRPVTINNEKLAVLNKEDNSFFFNKPVISVAFKLVISLAGKSTDE